MILDNTIVGSNIFSTQTFGHVGCDCYWLTKRHMCVPFSYGKVKRKRASRYSRVNEYSACSIWAEHAGFVWLVGSLRGELI